MLKMAVVTIWSCLRKRALEKLSMGYNIFVVMFIFVVCIKQKIHLAVIGRKYFHQPDLSEYCKRRAVPSVFLGNRVMEANSHVMQFSQLEVAYSCFISIRAESGYNIILVIELQSEYSLLEACSKNRNQLTVYELGETFGGYWGPQPDVMMKPRTRNYTQYYTLKTTSVINTKRTRKYKNLTLKGMLQTSTQPEPTDKESDYIRMEVPLVNVSGNLKLVGQERHTYNAEEIFDLIYDVTPRNGVAYETSIMPLLQFSIRPQKIGDYDKTPSYELDYKIREFTPDYRLTTHIFNRKLTKKSKWFNNRRYYNSEKKNNAPYSIKDATHKYQKFFTRWSYISPNTIIKNTIIPTLESKYSSVSWKHLYDIIKYFNVTLTQSTQVENFTMRNILNDISNMNHNLSVYLIPNISAYYNKNYIKNRDFTIKKFNDKPFTKKDMPPLIISSNPYNIKTLLRSPINKTNSVTNSLSPDINSLNNESWTSTVSLVKESNFYDNQSMVVISDHQITVNSRLENKEIHTKVSDKTIYKKSTKIQTEKNSFNNNSATSKIAPFKTGMLVDHESWENIVQAAPVMAVVLNKTNIHSNNNKTNVTNRERQEKVNIKKRKKRHIQALLIENSRPRNLTSKPSISTETEQVFRISNLHDLARLVELQDDEIEGRVALRYLRNYLGSALFNLCDMTEPKLRHTFLFNASRIVIALNNFTIDHMILVATPAQSILSSMSRCPSGSLECQAVGSRVCIDSTNACDGIPNCGSYDIYDEDRLLCGTSNDLEFNIYLATLTFLAVLLTMLYIVYYWLRRCIPGVSEAFFIYTDGSENTLYLDTIMRSPIEMDDSSCKFMFSGHFFEDDLYHDTQQNVDGNLCQKILKKYCGFLLFKRKRREKISEDITEEYEFKPEQFPKRFSFTELELRKYAPTTSKDQEIQTGDSIELIKSNEIKSEMGYDKEPIHKTNMIPNDKDYANELSLIKFAKETKSSSSQSFTFSVDKTDIKLSQHASADDEKVIRNTIYEGRSNKSPLLFEATSKTPEVCPEKPKLKIETKHLRFDEEPTLIPSTENEEDETIDKIVTRRSVLLGISERNKQNIDTIAETGEASTSGKDFMRFWGAKGRKGKRKEKSFLKRQ